MVSHLPVIRIAAKHPERISGIISQNGNVYQEGLGKKWEKAVRSYFDYQNNVKLYPVFQKYLRAFKPPVLAVWKKNDPSFISAGAEAFLRDVPDAEIHLVDSGHFALESCCGEIAGYIKNWTKKLL